MKTIFICLVLAISSLSYGQSIKKIIDNNDIEGLKKYIDKQDEIYEETKTRNLMICAYVVRFPGFL